MSNITGPVSGYTKLYADVLHKSGNHPLKNGEVIKLISLKKKSLVNRLRRKCVYVLEV